MFKRLFAAFFTLMIIISCTTVAFAADDDLELMPDGGYDTGDVDMDGSVSVIDATKIQLHLAMLATLDDEQMKLADTNYDGNLSIMDATYIQMYLAGLLDIAPVTPTQRPTEDDDKPIELPFVPAH